MLNLSTLPHPRKSVSKFAYSNTLKFVVRKKSEPKKEEDLKDEGIEDLLGEETKVTVCPPDGEYSSFPQIHRKTVEVLQKAGYKALFPIQ